MRWVFRAIVLVAVVVIIAGMVRHELLLWNQPPAENENVGNPPAEVARNDGNQPAIGQPTVADGAPIADDTGNPPPKNLRNPITQGLAQIIDGQQSVLGDSGDGLQNSLEQADELLYRAKQTNANAIREANRQMRVRHSNGDSPDVVFIVVSGLEKKSLGCFGGDESTAAFDAVAMRGARQTIDGVNLKDAQAAIIQGSSSANARNLLFPTFWQGGYSTALIGDCSWWKADQTRDIDFWFGHKTAEATGNAYPESVWANGREVKLPGNAQGKQQVAAHSLFADEAVDFITRYRDRLPYFLAVSFDVRAQAFPADWKAAERVAVANQHIAEIEEAISNRGWTNQTLLVVVGLPEDGADAPLLVRWPRRIAPNLSIVSNAQFAALPRTLVSLARVQRKPRSLSGENLAKIWRTPVNQ